MGREEEGEEEMGGRREEGKVVGNLPILRKLCELKVQQTPLISQLYASLLEVQYYLVQPLSIIYRFGQQGTGT